MKKSLIAGIIGMGLLNFIAPSKIDAEKNVSLSASVGTYILPEEVTSVSGFPYGGGVAVEGGKGRIGFKGGIDIFFKRGNNRFEYDSRGRVREGEEETAQYTRIYAGPKIGNENGHGELGIVAVEVSDLYETTERAGLFGRQEINQFPSRKSLGGIYGGATIKGKLDDNLGFFLNFSADYLFKGAETPVTGIKASAGVSF